MIHTPFRSSFFENASNYRSIIIILMLGLMGGCAQKSSKVISKPQTPTYTKEQVMVFINGNYISTASDMKPVPMQGEKQFYRDMYLDLRYPAKARENSTQGSVLFEVIIDKNGIVESISKTKSLTPECDEEAERAIRRGCKQNFEPFEFKGNLVKIKYLIPVKFRLM